MSMRALIEVALARHLSEATLNMEKDVEYIFQKSGFKDVVDAVASRDRDRMKEVFSRFDRNRNRPFFMMRSSDLKSRVGKKANKMNPVKITVGAFADGSFYRPVKQEIQISLNLSAMDVLKNAHYIPDVASGFIGGRAPGFWSEFSASSLKGTIYHELSHWADDTLHGGYIAKNLERVRETGSMTPLLGKHAYARHTPMEFNAQIHAMRVIRKQIGKRAYDKLGWIDLFQTKTSLAANFRGYRDEDEYDDAVKRFVKRLHREGLLGKKMRRFPNWETMKVIVRSV